MYDSKNLKLNKYGNKPRIPGMAVNPDKVDEYMKQTFGLTDKELKQMDIGTMDWDIYWKRMDKLSKPVFECNFKPAGSKVKKSISKKP